MNLLSRFIKRIFSSKKADSRDSHEKKTSTSIAKARDEPPPYTDSRYDGVPREEAHARWKQYLHSETIYNLEGLHDTLVDKLGDATVAKYAYDAIRQLCLTFVNCLLEGYIVFQYDGSADLKGKNQYLPEARRKCTALLVDLSNVLARREESTFSLATVGEEQTRKTEIVGLAVHTLWRVGMASAEKLLTGSPAPLVLAHRLLAHCNRSAQHIFIYHTLELEPSAEDIARLSQGVRRDRPSRRQKEVTKTAEPSRRKTTADKQREGDLAAEASAMMEKVRQMYADYESLAEACDDEYDGQYELFVNQYEKFLEVSREWRVEDLNEDQLRSVVRRLDNTHLALTASCISTSSLTLALEQAYRATRDTTEWMQESLVG